MKEAPILLSFHQPLRRNLPLRPYVLTMDFTKRPYVYKCLAPNQIRILLTTSTTENNPVYPLETVCLIAGMRIQTVPLPSDPRIRTVPQGLAYTGDSVRRPLISLGLQGEQPSPT